MLPNINAIKTFSSPSPSLPSFKKNKQASIPYLFIFIEKMLFFSQASMS